MSYYPTEEEEYELLYGDELEALRDIEEENINPDRVQSKSDANTTQQSLRDVSSPTAKTSHNVLSQKSPTPRPGTSKSFFQNSPALSQISYNGSQQHVNRRLFGTPHPGPVQRVASTPYTHGFGPVTSNTADDHIDVDQQISLPTRKRRLEDLFGDIHDIEEDLEFVYQSVEKKAKTEEEIDIEMIAKILEARKQLRAQQNPLRKTNLDKLEALDAFKKRNLSRNLPNWPFTTLQRDDGDRLYVRLHSKEFENQQIAEINLHRNHGALLGNAKANIWRTAQEIIEKRLTSSQANRVAETVPDEVELIPESSLWVEKYQPKKYLDLLSDESTNRSLLSWLKLWDKVVFNKKFSVKAMSSGPQNSFNKKTGKFEAFGRFRKKGKAVLNTDVDERGRPVQKIALLCGAPGLGKTTLAHTIARHAGYSVLEINASDDRSPEAFKLALESGTQMKSVLDKEKRPNCIILDEIDGAPLPTIEYLIRFVSDNVQQHSSKKSGNKKTNILKRPIICICNDLYVAALRQLRQIAFVVNFPQLDGARLAERLLSIADRENVRTDMTALLALAEKSGNDVRSCMSMLQFFSSIQQPLTLIDVLKRNIGEKDRQKGLFSIWSSIFQIQRPRKTLTDAEDDGGQLVTISDATDKSRMNNILNVVNMGADYERLMTGVFENYLLQKMPDPNFVGVTDAMEWFCFSDRVRHCVNKEQNYTIYPYLQFGFVVWHFQFAGMVWPKINFPNKGFEFSQKHNLQKVIQTALRKGFGAMSRGVGEGPAILLDTVPLLKKIICPSIRSVSLQLLTPRERADLRHAVEVMVDLGLAYTQMKSVDGAYQYQIEPDIDVLCHFNDIQSHPLSYWNRQIIAREVELERMRRAVPKSTASDTVINKKLVKNNNLQQTTKSKNFNQQTARSNTANVKETITKDFFGRILTKQRIITVQEGGTDVIVKSPIWYRYKEGFNNAVRKDVTISDLL